MKMVPDLIGRSDLTHVRPFARSENRVAELLSMFPALFDFCSHFER